MTVFKVFGVLFCFVIGFSQASALGCCGEEDTHRPSSDALGWTESFELASQQARDLKQPFVVLFVSRELMQTAGEGPAIIKQYEAKNGKPPEMTLVDYAAGIEPIQRSGVRIFVKVAETDANKELFKKYNASSSTVVFIGPDGKKLCSYKGSDCSPEKFKPVLEKFEEKMDEWRRQHSVAVVEKK